LLGKYAWAEHGSDEANGPLLKKGLTLELRDSEHKATLSNVTGQLEGLDNAGDDLTIVKEMIDDGGVACWLFEVRTEPKTAGEGLQPISTSWRLYGSEYRDDNGFPFIEVRDSNSMQYAYGKREVNLHKPTGFTQAEKERIHFLPVSYASMSEGRYQFEKRMATKDEIDHEPLNENEVGTPYYLYKGQWTKGFVSSSVVITLPYLCHR
jgi:hypothetical protein